MSAALKFKAFELCLRFRPDSVHLLNKVNSNFPLDSEKSAFATKILRKIRCGADEFSENGTFPVLCLHVD